MKMLRASGLARTAAARYLGVAAMPAVASCFILSSPQAPFAISKMPNTFSPALSSRPGRLGLRVSMSTGSEDTVVAGMERKLRDAFKPTVLEVIPAYGDPNGSHVTIKVVSDEFEGKRAVQRQQMVYKVIWEEMQGAIHAVDQMVVKTPKEDGQ